ncbi:condensation domain-containing protein [Pseudomonas sp. PCH446]
MRVPDNLIVPGCERITPDMLPLADLDQAAIDRIVAGVPGGVANVQDIYALAPLQEGILYHHLAAHEGDPYVLQVLFAFDNRERLGSFALALQSVVERHDILRTSVVWEGLDQPVQVVWRTAQLSLEEVALDPAAGDVLAQLHERFDPRHYRLDIGRAPLMRIAYAQDMANQRWVGMLLFHHMAWITPRWKWWCRKCRPACKAWRAIAGAGTVSQPRGPGRLGVSQQEHEGSSARCSAISTSRRCRMASRMYRVTAALSTKPVRCSTAA